ncbi:MAG: hypothetical protein IJZ55_09140 [Lachnospiraceae bacterium]|nr:hypothetical protein [Lachnospiraceae bacterium]
MNYNNVNHISKGVSEQRVQEFKAKYQEQKPLLLYKIVWITFLVCSISAVWVLANI